MYNDIDKKFDHITQKALPYLILASPTFRKKLVELMDALFHQLLQRSEADFDEIYWQINELLDGREKFESTTENKIHNFEGRFKSYGQQISEMGKRLDKSERKIKSIENILKELQTDVPDAIPPIEVLKTPDGFFCGFCKTTKLKKKGEKYYSSLGMTLKLYQCPSCTLTFKMDETGNVIPTKRKKIDKNKSK